MFKNLIRKITQVKIILFFTRLKCPFIEKMHCGFRNGSEYHASWGARPSKIKKMLSIYGE